MSYTPSEKELLAGCRVLYPSLFAHGLGPQGADGPQTVAKMADVRSRVWRILVAAAEADPRGRK